MAESKVTQKDTPRQESKRDPAKEALDILLDCGAISHVLSRLFELKRNENGDYAFYDGLLILNNEVDAKIQQAVEILEGG